VKFGKGFSHRVKAVRRKPGSAWHFDEMSVTLRGELYLLWRVGDEHGAELDILLQKRRDKAAARICAASFGSRRWYTTRSASS